MIVATYEHHFAEMAKMTSPQNNQQTRQEGFEAAIFAACQASMLDQCPQALVVKLLGLI